MDNFASYIVALREDARRFEEERDRRYTEVNIEREKALKIKETADRDAMALARESQTYKEQQSDILRDKNLAESGVYARTADVDASIEKLGLTVTAQIEALLTKIEPFMSGSISQTGQQQGAKITWGKIYAAITAGAAVLGGFYYLTHPHG